MSTHICAPPTFNYRTISFCPTCGCRRRMLVECAAWWGTTWTCLTCGDGWAEEGRLPRPFARGWRGREVARAKAAPYTTKRKARAAEWRYISGGTA